MWTDETRLRHDRSGLRYTHDLTNEEWAEVEPLIPPAKPGGNKRTVNIREVLNGLMYLLGSGCQWRDIPEDLPPRSTIHVLRDNQGENPCCLALPRLRCSLGPTRCLI
jgi:transposase